MKFGGTSVGSVERIQAVADRVLQHNQRNRCPGAMERGTVWKPSSDYPCDETQIPLGD